ncbi:MAG: hypothetical protein COV34_00540 [Candidatus Zambryskibacteria bacterium CG10_big_fil_rev_8_21_14_0_10_42_12]|uniref:AI-2E family transporter n=1 Tax=Candidatus Zambryskibacteria bacterium CG10_big_fil_rev_8_21_14_0_10_42_12 TaxID=1975115 RepID=A0A2H0QX02_9BACT|nr:MAG: hypothetical protein COV34_00540 [Candidatus Zambryskibacteria bacterium CG10_big_fil_rev_8_21_14_0_10_42_12]
MGAHEKEPHTFIHISAASVVKAILIIVFFIALYVLRDIALVLLTSIVVASSIEPGAQWFIARRVPRVLGVLTIYLGTALLLSGTFYFLFLPFLNETTSFLSELPSTASQVSLWNPLQEGGEGIAATFAPGLSIGDVVGKLQSTLVNLGGGGFLSAASAISGGVLSLLLIIVLSFYLAVQDDGVGKFLKIIVPLKQEPYVIDLWKRTRSKIGKWLQGQLLLGVLVMVLVYLGLTLIGVQHALLLAVLAGIFELIPLFGPIIASIPAIAFGYIDGGVSLALIVTGLYVIVQQFESHLIYPLVVKKVVGVPPIISIIALVIGGKLAGFLGIILAVPVATVFIEILDDMEKQKKALKASS